jgi:hypothetical protein
MFQFDGEDYFIGLRKPGGTVSVVWGEAIRGGTEGDPCSHMFDKGPATTPRLSLGERGGVKRSLLRLHFPNTPWTSRELQAMFGGGESRRGTIL